MGIRLPGTAIAIDKNASHVVVGGALDDLDELEQATKSLGAHTTWIKVSVLGHTRWLASAADAFRKNLALPEQRSTAAPILAEMDCAVRLLDELGSLAAPEVPKGAAMMVTRNSQWLAG